METSTKLAGPEFQADGSVKIDIKEADALEVRGEREVIVDYGKLSFQIALPEDGPDLLTLLTLCECFGPEEYLKWVFARFSQPYFIRHSSGTFFARS